MNVKKYTIIALLGMSSFVFSMNNNELSALSDYKLQGKTEQELLEKQAKINKKFDSFKERYDNKNDLSWYYCVVENQKNIKLSEIEKALEKIHVTKS